MLWRCFAACRPRGLHPGQVGTVVELLEGNVAHVEYSNNEGRAYAVAPCSRADLLVYKPCRKWPERVTRLRACQPIFDLTRAQNLFVAGVPCVASRPAL